MVSKEVSHAQALSYMHSTYPSRSWWCFWVPSQKDVGSFLLECFTLK